MKNIISSIVLLISVFITQAQTFEWLRPHDIDYDYNPEMINYTSASDQEENAYLFGSSTHIEFYNGSFGDLMIIKYDTDGGQQWMNIIDGTGMAKGSVCDASGTLYMIGKHRSTLNFWNDDTLSYFGTTTNSFLAKVQPDGFLEWALNINDIYPESTDVNDIVCDDEGNIFVAISGFQDSYVTKFNPDGEILFEILQTKAGLISGIDISNEGKLVVTGSCSSSESLFAGVSYVSPFDYSMYIALYDESGFPQWVEFAEDVTCIFPKVKFDMNGNIFWTGPLHINAVFGGIQSGGPTWVYDFFVTKISSAGNFEWVFEVPQPTTGDALIGKISPLDFTANGSIILGGFNRNTVDWGNDVVSSTDNYYNLLIMEVSTDGIAQWVKTAGGDYYDHVHSLSVSPLGNIFIAGVAGDTVSFDTITYQSDQFFYPFLAKIDYETATGINTVEKEKDEIIIYPNPATSRIYLGTDQLRQIRIVRGDGVLVMESMLPEGQTFIDIAELANGLYVLEGITKDNRRQGGRFIKQ